MPRFARETGPKRLFAAALVVCSAAFAAGCSQTTGSVAPSASARSDFADSGQPILLNSGAAAGSQAGAGTAQANAAPAQTGTAQGAQPAGNKKLAVIPLSPAAGGTASSGTLATPRVATAAAPRKPAATDAISLVPADDSAPAADNPDAAAASAASAEAPAPADTSGTEVISDGQATGQEKISADAKAKLIGELQALKKRPGAAPEGNAAAAQGNAAAATDCADGSLDPQCAATE